MKIQFNVQFPMLSRGAEAGLIDNSVESTTSITIAVVAAWGWGGRSRDDLLKGHTHPRNFVSKG